MVYASMQCDTCPLTSLRGKCTIKHRDEIDDLDAYRRQRDNFYFDKFYDRYMIRYYEVVPSKKVINVPAHIKKVLDQRWKYVIVEIGRPKEELCKAGKTCKKCGKFAATSASVDCAECKATYHMNCVDPPLLRKPQRGFAWSCAACSRVRERKLEARNTPSMGVMLNRRDGIELFTEDKEDKDEMEVDQPAASQDSAVSADGDKEAGADQNTQAAEVPIDAPLKLTPEQQRQSQLWPFRYFGMHSKAEDILDLDDRINPRAKSRIGGRHQATVPPWYGHPVAYVKKKKGGRRELAARD
ncbi:putative PHD type zinc finger protein with BAH domain-containing protein, partial [Ascosphaera atra]